MMGQEKLSPATLDAVARLLERFQIPKARAAALVKLVELLAFDPLAPTALRDPVRILDDHVADSLVALELEPVSSATRAADIGSGAGLPGIPLALAMSGARFSLLESSRRKAAFLARAVTECGLTNVAVVAERAESWREGIDGCDLVTARAVAGPDVIVEYAAPLLRVGGSVVVWRGKRDPEAEARAGRAAEVLGLEVSEPVAVQPFPGAQHRHLHVFSKVAETPARFPRRPGMAEKRPLGGAP